MGGGGSRRPNVTSAPPSSSYLQVAPDLVVEVVPPNDASTDLEAKAEQWIEAGTKIVLVADPKNQTLRVYKIRARHKSKCFVVAKNLRVVKYVTLG